MGSDALASPVDVGTVSGNGAAAVEAESEKSRRALLKGLGVVAAGAVVGGVLTPGEAEAHHGTFNADSNNSLPAIHGSNSDAGDGVEGDSVSGRGVFGRSTSGVGVLGAAGSSTGVRGVGNVGVVALGSFLGLDGLSSSGTGVRATSTSGTALDVVGPAKFSTAGAGIIPANQNSVAVGDPAVTADSHITMTYTGNPGITSSGTFAAVVWVERQPGIGFTARLSRRVTNATPFTYLIVEPG